ncbi:MAG: radical SAM protein [Candidatus Omnitrophica bacterium]|nr:radical SAM protein [Candidatus Omnitrophota bacterium]
MNQKTGTKKSGFLRKIADKILYRHSQKEPVASGDLYGRLYSSIFSSLESPYMIEWFPAYICNSRCQYCGGYDSDSQRQFEPAVPYERIVGIVRESSRNGTEVWNIGGRGGEPLLYKNIIGILREIKKCNMRGILITNGLLLDEAFIGALHDIRWDLLRISLDSSSGEIHDEIRGVPGNFRKIDNALTKFADIKTASDKTAPYIICCPVVHKKNYRRILELIDYCIEKKVEEIQLMPLMNVHSRAEQLMLTEEESRECVSLLRQKADETRIKHNINFFLAHYGKKPERNAGREEKEGILQLPFYCIHVWKTLVISEDGYLSPCTLIKDKLCKIGDSYQKAWQGDQMNKLREKVSQKQFIHQACHECCGPLRSETYEFNQYLLERDRE